MIRAIVFLVHVYSVDSSRGPSRSKKAYLKPGWIQLHRVLRAFLAFDRTGTTRMLEIVFIIDFLPGMLGDVDLQRKRVLSVAWKVASARCNSFARVDGDHQTIGIPENDGLSFIQSC